MQIQIAKAESMIESKVSAHSIEEILLLVWNEKWAINWIKRYKPELIGEVPEGWDDEKLKELVEEPLPNEIENYLESLAMKAKAYGNSMYWREEKGLKKYFKENRNLCRSVSSEALRNKCNELGMSLKDINYIVALYEKFCYSC